MCGQRYPESAVRRSLCELRSWSTSRKPSGTNRSNVFPLGFHTLAR
jgi:hypothetical protein